MIFWYEINIKKLIIRKKFDENKKKIVYFRFLLNCKNNCFDKFSSDKPVLLSPNKFFRTEKDLSTSMEVNGR